MAEISVTVQTKWEPTFKAFKVPAIPVYIVIWQSIQYSNINTFCNNHKLIATLWPYGPPVCGAMGQFPLYPVDNPALRSNMYYYSVPEITNV